MNDTWIQVTPSEYPWEREALEHLKHGLPDHEPYRAWANFEFVLDGVISEVDALVAVPKGIFLVEIKSWPGRLEGDAGTWRLTRPGASGPTLLDNPLLLANRKAKRLKSLLYRQRAFRGERVPFIAPLMFLSHAELDCRLAEDARHGVCGLDRAPDGSRGQRGGLPGLIETLTKLSREEASALGERRIDRPSSARLADALEQAGIRPARRMRTIGDLQLRELLDDGPGYQDFLAVHPRFPRVEHRARIYGTAEQASAEEREQALRAAQREYELLHTISHPGIAAARSFHEHELGPAIVFDRDPTEVRLDHFLEQAGPSLSLDDRLALVRELAEALAYAHRHRLYHRALSPRAVLVSAPSKPTERRLRIISWQTGARAGAGSSPVSVSGTQHLEDLIDEGSAAYLAPESLIDPDADPELLDVFSLGALAYLIFSGSPPARTRAELVDALEPTGSLEVAAALDGAGGALLELIRESTRADATRRLAGVEDVLAGLDLVEEEATRPSIEPEATVEVSPPQAKAGDQVAGFAVTRRLGRGSTAVALLARDEDGSERVLKVAADPERNQRVRDEAEVLARLRHPAIIATGGEPLEQAGHAILILAYASEGTLARRLRSEGSLPFDSLRRWGEDLLSALAYLEQEGIPHRDIKPDNLGILPQGKSKERHLVLFDFSLARAPADQLQVGTRPYLDPFLGVGERRRWDLAADRYAAAVVLYEMATGAPPSWGADPRFTNAELPIVGDAMPRELAAPLVDFFTRALRRNARERFDTAEEMLRAWRRMFETIEPVADDREAWRTPGSEPIAQADFETPVAALGLSARGLDVLERLGVLSVADLIETQPFWINRMRGIGVRTRAELVAARRELRNRLGLPRQARSRTTVTGTAPDGDVQQLDQLVAQLIPRRERRNGRLVEGLQALLGLEPDAGAPGRWPSQADVADLLGVTRPRAAQIMGQGRERWRRLPALTRLREELREALDRLGGVAAVAELEREVAAERGGELGNAAPLARAAVRAAIEVDLALEQPRFRTRRAGERVLVASAGETPEERQRVLAYASALGEAADRLAARETLAGTHEAAAALARVSAPDQVAALTPERRVRLAAHASTGAAVSARLELYPRGMPIERALRLARGALSGADALSASELAVRVAARFPEAQTLPGRPALDALLEAAGIELRFDAERGAYVSRQARSLGGLTSHGSSSSLQRVDTYALTTLPTREEPAVRRAREFEQRLQASLRAGGLLYLCTAARHYAKAASELRRFQPEVVDLDELLLRELHAAAGALKVHWEVVLRADATAPGEADWMRLGALVQRALPVVEEELASVGGAALAVHPGLLARYGEVSIFDRLRERMLAGAALRSLWVLVPGEGQDGRPVLDGVALPVITPGEVVVVPQSWLANLHRAQRHPPASTEVGAL